MLNTAVKAARRAGAIINRASLDLDLLRIGKKAPNDFVTEVDRSAEAAIIEILSKAYPDHDFLAEETGTAGAHGKRAVQSDYVWIIDPLDGTPIYHGFRSTRVDRTGASRPGHAGVIYDPVHNDLFWPQTAKAQA